MCDSHLSATNSRNTGRFPSSQLRSCHAAREIGERRLTATAVRGRLCPIFQVSNVTGLNLDLLKMFMNLLTTRPAGRRSDPAEFQIDDTYSVPVSAGSILAWGEVFRVGVV